MSVFIEGHSDDTVAWGTDGFPVMRGDSLDDCASGQDFVLTFGNEATGGCRVVFAYARGDSPGWAATVDMLEEDVPIPWPISICGSGYGVSVEIVGATLADLKSAVKRKPQRVRR